MKTLTDVSYYQNFSPAIYDMLATETDGIIVRTGFNVTNDTMARTHIENARARNMPVASYHWCDPLRSVYDQSRFITDTVQKYRLPSVWLDMEQYWKDWSAYMRGDYTTAFATRFTPEQLEASYHKLYNEVVRALANTDVEVGIYSADWFIDKYCPTLKNWVFDKNYWEARYLRYYNPVGLKAVYTANGKPISICDINKFQPVAPIVRGIARQFESYIEIRELPNNYHQDWNFITDDGFNKMFQLSTPTVPEPPVILPVTTKNFIVNTWTLNIRTGAGIAYPKIGTYFKGMLVAIYEVSGDWGRTDRGWINLTYTLPTQSSFKVTAVWLNIREYPTTNSRIVGGLKLGDIVYQINTNGNWIYIGTGWVSMTYLKPA